MTSPLVLLLTRTTVLPPHFGLVSTRAVPGCVAQTPAPQAALMSVPGWRAL